MRRFDAFERRAPADGAETPAVVCPACRGETPLAAITMSAADPPRCRHCATLLFDEPRVVPAPGARAALISFVEALEARDADAARALLRPDVTWREPDTAMSAFGPSEVVALLLGGSAARSIWQVAGESGDLDALILERGAQPADDRLVRWLVQCDDGLIGSCWVWILRRGPGLSGLREP